MLRALLISSVCLVFVGVRGNPDVKRLYNDLLRRNNYNKLIRPAGNHTDKLTVRLGLRLSQLIDVDEKNQIITTNVWLPQEWEDSYLRWNPRDYGGVTRIYVPAEEIWVPDILLFNNADGHYEVSFKTKATVNSFGLVRWEPPAIFKSSCTMDVEYFPYDVQQCVLKFGSWSYDGYQLDLKHISHSAGGNDLDVIPTGIDLAVFYKNAEWELLDVPAKKYEKYYPCCPEPYPDITFNITIRRKTLFYTVNLIVPCVVLSFLSVLVFYLPAGSGEKVALSISILLSLIVFLLLLSETIPPTSLVVPLIGKYLLFTMILVALSIIATVLVLNVHFRSPAYQTMSPWVRKVFLNILPRLLFIHRPLLDRERDLDVPVRTCNCREMPESFGASGGAFGGGGFESRGELEATGLKSPESGILPVAHKAIDGACFIAGHLKEKGSSAKIKEDWESVAFVLDRLFLWVFTTVFVSGACGILLKVPTLYDDTPPLL